MNPRDRPARRRASDPRRAGRAETHEKRPVRPCWCREHGPERPRSREWRLSDLCAKRPDQPWPTLRASAAAVPPEHWFTRASDASPWRLGLPALAGCGRLSRPVGLRCSPARLPRQTGRSDLCSRHQHGSAGHSSCCVNRVSQLCRISQVCRKLARDAGPVALAATHAPSDLPMMTTASMQRVLGHATRVCFCQLAKSVFRTHLFPRRAGNGAVLSCLWACASMQAMH